MLLFASPALAESARPAQPVVDTALPILAGEPEARAAQIQLPQMGCQLSVGNCTDNGTCEVSLGRCDGICFVNLGSLCEGNCPLNVGGACLEGKCYLNIASACTGYCDVNVAGQCHVIFGPLATSSPAALDGYCFLNDPTSHCAEEASCYVNVGNANCQYGGCFVNVAASCHHHCFVNVVSGCYGTCYVNVYATCHEVCQVSISVLCDLVSASTVSFASAEAPQKCKIQIDEFCGLGLNYETYGCRVNVGPHSAACGPLPELVGFAVADSSAFGDCVLRSGSMCIIGIGQGTNSYGCDIRVGGPALGVRAFCEE